MRDSTYQRADYTASEIEHRYGDGVHIMRDPLAISILNRLCAHDCQQPTISRLIRILYTRLIHEVINTSFPRVVQQTKTRMYDITERGVFEGQAVNPATSVVSVAIARAGILPSQVCYEYLTDVLDPAQVRQDHLVMSRVVDESQHVTGAAIQGNKVGGPIDGRVVLFPDPMGATGNSLAQAISFYKNKFGDSPDQLITLNLIITPEFVRRLRDAHPTVTIFALRLDRGMSSQEVLDTVPGTRWDDESGLTETDYIVPGGGGFGEIMNNAYV